MHPHIPTYMHTHRDTRIEIYMYLYSIYVCPSTYLSVCMYVPTHVIHTHSTHIQLLKLSWHLGFTEMRGWSHACDGWISSKTNCSITPSTSHTYLWSSIIPRTESVSFYRIHLFQVSVEETALAIIFSFLHALKTLWYAKGQSSRERSCKPGQGIQRHHIFKDRIQCNCTGQTFYYLRTSLSTWNYLN